jgi:hypothetical protein
MVSRTHEHGSPEIKEDNGMQYRRIWRNVLIGTAFAAGCLVWSVAPADAETNPSSDDPFGALQCGACHHAVGPGGLELGINNGLRQALGP